MILAYLCFFRKVIILNFLSFLLNFIIHAFLVFVCYIWLFTYGNKIHIFLVRYFGIRRVINGVIFRYFDVFIDLGNFIFYSFYCLVLNLFFILFDFDFIGIFNIFIFLCVVFWLWFWDLSKLQKLIYRSLLLCLFKWVYFFFIFSSIFGVNKLSDIVGIIVQVHQIGLFVKKCVSFWPTI